MRQGIWVALGCLIGAVVGAVVVRGMVQAPAPPHDGREETPFQSGMSAVFAGDYAGAVAMFDRLEPGFARMDQVLFWKGFSLRAQGKFGAAIEAYDRLADGHPTSGRAAEAAYEAARILELDLGRPDEALARYRAIEERYPELRHKTQLRLGLLNERRQKWDAAEQCYTNSENNAQERGLPEHNWTMQSSKNRRDFLAKNSDYDRRPLVLWTEAEALEREGKTREAVARLQELARLYPKAELADDALARIVRIGAAAEAEAALRALREKHPDSPARKQVDH